MGEHRYYVYLLCSKPRGTLYVGVTNNLVKRVVQHKAGDFDGFTAKYKVDQLVYFEEYQFVHEAILREKRLKRWRREWKLELVEKQNPAWLDMFDSIDRQIKGLGTRLAFDSPTTSFPGQAREMGPGS